MRKILIRLYQKIMYLACLFLHFKEPSVLQGPNSYEYLAMLLKSKARHKVLIVTGEKLYSLDTIRPLTESFYHNHLQFVIFHSFTQDPDIKEIEDGVSFYIKNQCDCIVAIGGGTILDGAKIIAARITNDKPVLKMKGLFKIKNKLPLLVAIPTTAGTGSETTLAAVVSDKEKNIKFAIEDLKLIPPYAVLNPTLLSSLPNQVTAMCGMDAFTHAIEAYIGKANTRKTKKYAIEAIQLIHSNLLNSYQSPYHLNYKENMLEASYKAGVAFTRAYVGYVHALAHALGAFYHLPHGLLNAVLLPVVLKKYGHSATNKLALLYDVIEPDNNFNKQEKADHFIAYIESLNKKMNLSVPFKDIIKTEDIPLLVKHSYKEAVPLYPTPSIWNKKDFQKMYEYLQTL